MTHSWFKPERIISRQSDPVAPEVKAKKPPREPSAKVLANTPDAALSIVSDELSVRSDNSVPRPGDAYVQSFARGLEVLRSFGAHTPAQTLSEVAANTGLTRAGARRILLTLLALGYVTNEGRLFRLTPKVLELGFAYLTSQPFWTQAQPAMESLVEQLRQSSSAAVLDGCEVVYVVRVPAHKIMSINLGVGSRLPAHCSSMGRVLLAGLPDDQLDQRLSEMTLTAYTPQTIVDHDRLRDVLMQVRAQGWCLVREELEPGLVSVAAPIRDINGRVVAAINVSGSADKASASHVLDVCLPKLLAAASRINVLLGASH
ncbi:MAG: IclR family transcriptional regulator C-terminal domain-containing protein [Pusillimonas sp.]